MTVKTTYVALEGKEFPTEKQALDYEAYVKKHEAHCKVLSKKLTKEIVDLICPEHDRTSCSDTNLCNGPSKRGCRCTRCGLLDMVECGDFLTRFQLNVTLSCIK